jgi:16S rRNA G966 N2-methylase RsmD
MVEKHAPALRQLERSRDKLQAAQISVVRADALAFAADMQQCGENEQFDLIFLDPPYQQDWLAKILPACAPLLAENGLVYVEAEFSLAAEPAPAWLQNWQLLRADKAGAVFFHLLQVNKSA